MRTTVIITGIVLVIFGALYLIARLKVKNLPAVENHEKIITLTDKNFQHQTKNNVMLVDFWAEWCPPCKMMAPVLNDVAAELTGNAYVGKVDVDQYQLLAQQYQVRNIPTMILYKNGKEIERFVGIKSKAFLVQQINKVK